MTVRILTGDCRDVLKTLAEASVDSIVTDPPYHRTAGKKGGSGPASVNLESPYGRARVTTGFMGMTWDGGDVPVLEQLRRMAKDAARYRFLSCKGVPPYFHRCSRWRLEYWNGEWWDPLMKEELDAAIDAQIEQERSEQAKEPK